MAVAVQHRARAYPVATQAFVLENFHHGNEHEGIIHGRLKFHMTHMAGAIFESQVATGVCRRSKNIE